MNILLREVIISRKNLLRIIYPISLTFFFSI